MLRCPCPHVQVYRGSVNSFMWILSLCSHQISTQIANYRCGTNPLWKSPVVFFLGNSLVSLYLREPGWCGSDKEWIPEGTCKISATLCLSGFNNWHIKTFLCMFLSLPSSFYLDSSSSMYLWHRNPLKPFHMSHLNPGRVCCSWHTDIRSLIQEVSLI